MKNTTLTEYAYEIHKKERNTVIFVFYHGIKILTGYPREMFGIFTPSIVVKSAKYSGEKVVILEIDVDESEA